MSNIDRSLIFTALLDLSPEFRVKEVGAGASVIADIQTAWDADRTYTDLYAFVRVWLADNPGAVAAAVAR